VPPHVCATIIDGYGEFWAHCEDCLFRMGPYTDEIDADWSVLWHREITTPPDQRK
jgi:hypothetical protein